MNDAPSTQEIIAAVRRFITETAAPQLDGHGAFHARVAANLLSTLERELALRPAAETAEEQRLRVLLGDTSERSLVELNKKLCGLIAEGAMDAATPGLLAHLKSTTIDQLSIDQPKYSGLMVARDGPAES